MSTVFWALPLPSGKTAEVRDVTIGDLEAVGLDWDKLARRTLISVDGVKDDKAGKWPVRMGDFSALVAWVQKRVEPEPDFMASITRTRTPDGLDVEMERISVSIAEPDVETWQSATNYGQAGLSGGLRLLRRCITHVGGKAVTYADLAGDRWPFDAPVSLVLHAQLVFLLSEPVDKRDAREGLARAVTTPRA